MNEFQILLTVMISGFGFFGAILLLIWRRIEYLDGRINHIENVRISKIEMDMVEIKTILRMLEGSLSTHGHCLFNQSHKEIKAE